jgi:hypothetical protein
MFHKGPSVQARMFGLKNQAISMGRNLYNKAQIYYQSGKHIAHAIDRGYTVFKKIHGAMAPALQNASPELAKVAKKAMSSYEATRAAVMNADQVGQRIGGAMRF